MPIISSGPENNYSPEGDSRNDLILGSELNDTMKGMGNDDAIHGYGGNDKIWGGDGDDGMSGGAGRDKIWGEAGNDFIGGFGAISDNAVDYHYGGTGSDDIIVDSMSSYDMSVVGAIVTLTHKDSSGDINQFINFENVDHESIPYDNDTKTLVSLYDNIFDRQADLGGLQFYYNEVQNGDSLGTVAVEYIASSEYTNDINGGVAFTSLDNEGQVGELYQALLGRDADQSGLDYWTGQVDSGTSIQHVADVFIASSEFTQLAVTEWDFIV